MSNWKELIAEKQARGDLLAVVILPQDPPVFAGDVRIIGEPRATIEWADGQQYTLWYRNSDTSLYAGDMSDGQITGLLEIHHIPQDGWMVL